MSRENSSRTVTLTHTVSDDVGRRRCIGPELHTRPVVIRDADVAKAMT